MTDIRNLTSGPIRRQLIGLALPLMGTSFIQMAYSMTDMFWVGRLGSGAVAAIGAVGILTWMMTSVSYLTKVGAEVSVSQSIGAGSEDEAHAFASHNVTLALIISLTCMAVLFLFADGIIGLYGMEEDISHDAADYLRVIATGVPFTMLSAAFTGVYNAAGLTRIPFFISGTGLIMNMLLDPLFILSFGWGTQGAAWATWLSQLTVLLLFVWQLRFRRPLFGRFRFLTRLTAGRTAHILRLGTPVALMNALFAVINFSMARIASLHGGYLGVMALTAGGQMEAIAWNTSQGFSTALSTFTGQNYTARRYDRIRRAFRSTLAMTGVWGLLTTLLFVLFGDEVFALFVDEPAAYTIGGSFLRIDGYSMLLMMVEITIQGLFYGTGRTVPPAVISVTFNLLRIPLAILLATTPLGVHGIWWAVSLSSMAKGCAAFIWFMLLQKKILRQPVNQQI
ncbi:MAG: MATE family efflux transporter [bacterium]|uniref:MATE family efflux transporter n=1 Tax=Candidatus Aphodosoma intestinipullorum TaxID=2840674 RepID=A0A940DP32_9BACT|nr:MATE family efflux transporter [Candidatus Aphodosoma intestinipullorum]